MLLWISKTFSVYRTLTGSKKRQMNTLRPHCGLPRKIIVLLIVADNYSINKE